MSSFIELQNIIYPSSELSLTMILLEEWSFIYIEGMSSKEYLQNQLTIDMNLLSKKHHVLCAHCNFNGKVWSTMRLLHYDKGYGYIQRKSISKIQVNELKKYSIFSKIIIQELIDIHLVGIVGINSRSFLLKFFIKIPDKNCPVVYENKKVILWLAEPSERFLLILNRSDFLFFKKKINEKIFLNYSKQWLSLDIESGFPIIDKNASQKFTPQAINLDKLKAISFKKGCYYGQETIARIFFKNLNQRFLCCLISIGDISPKIGSIIETKIQNIWYKIGFLLSIVQIKSKELLIQAVLYKSVDSNNLFRIYGFENIFSIKN
ncbi:tRNA-modifying protein YgfZ [Buchnera aphidicola (Brachycaudus cardui)]|uniref:tRNA-modifying protein YgfZ n=1 Tax=Buchnera aphidicola (Brachycaudus cardui) TaxID=557993 RepID=A0A4D6XTU4_9GAMM|nr:tRNA-modifying protein YgfZ [Buchnera aphidicola]QCI20566.1 tRNA-modifying protein YgfZ [Buchnera aphidicola (Brachycaudus cardui)]